MSDYVRVYGEEGPTCGECGEPARVPDHQNPLEEWKSWCRECAVMNTYLDEAGDEDFEPEELDFN